MKFKGKKFISLVLAALMIVSVMFCGTVSASATWGTDGNSISHIYAYFDNSTMNYYSTASSARVYMFVATSDKVYNSAALSPVTNYQSLVYKDVNYNGSGDFANVNWANVTSVFFGTASAANKPKGEYLLSNYSNSLDNFKSNNGTFSNFTASYSTGFDVSNCNALYFYGSGSSLSGRNFGGTNTSAYENLNFSQNVFGLGTVEVKSYNYLSATSTVTAVSSNSTSSVDALYRTSVTIKATETGASGAFQGWYDNPAFTGAAISNNAEYTYTVNDENTYYAKFANSVTQTANAGSGGSAKVSGGGNSGTNIAVASGTSVSFTALPNPQYKFDGWYDNAEFIGDAVSTDDPYTFTATSANTLYAKFSAATYSSEEVELSTKNSGTRDSYDENDDYTASLSNQAKNYYKEEVKQYITSDKVYKTFVNLSGEEDNDSRNSYNAAFGNNTNSLFNTLYSIMDSTQNHGVVYASYGRNSLAHYWLNTDTSAVNAADGREVYTFFYSDVNCFAHTKMQREHIWPKSKASFLMKTGLGGSDLHHLRPAYGKVNNIKSNWGFADIIDDSTGNAKSGWSKLRTVKWPESGANAKTSLWRAEKNGETFCDYNKDVHGDIARILLYIYTRWKQPNLYSDITTTDSDGQTVPDTSRLPELDPDDSKDTGERVIYDLPTLLQWMKEDPVSEWEMQRNDLTQQVQGNRNVFIDYPELAWLLFDEAVPTDMDTPSGMAKANGDYTNDVPKNATVTPTNPITLDFKADGNGAGHITAYNNTTHSAVKDGDQVSRGDIITYSVVPDESTLTNIIEFSSSSNGTGNADRNTIAVNTDEAYSFTRQAGYFRDAPNTTIDSQTGKIYDRDRIKISLRSKVCVLSYNINSKTATGGSGGSGSGMVTMRKTGTNEIIENGGTVPNGTSVTFTFTPDYGSRFSNISNSNSIDIPTPTQISGTSSYQTTFTVSSLNSNNEEIGRTKKFTIYFAQTWNASAGSEDAKKHINNKGLRPDVDDPWGEQTDFSENFEICGVQVKRDDDQPASNKALRFVSVIDKNILAKAESYGWVIGYTNQAFDTTTVNRFAYTLVKDGPHAYTADCTGTSNDVYGVYGQSGTDTNYKYITATVNNIQAATSLGATPLATTIIARPYVVLKDEYVGTGAPSVIYGQYVDFSTGEEFCACSGSYNYISSLAG